MYVIYAVRYRINQIKEGRRKNLTTAYGLCAVCAIAWTNECYCFYVHVTCAICILCGRVFMCVAISNSTRIRFRIFKINAIYVKLREDSEKIQPTYPCDENGFIFTSPLRIEHSGISYVLISNYVMFTLLTCWLDTDFIILFVSLPFLCTHTGAQWKDRERKKKKTKPKRHTASTRPMRNGNWC